MSLASGVGVLDECISTYNDFKSDKSTIKYIIYKVSDNNKNVVIESVGKLKAGNKKTDKAKTDEVKTDEAKTDETKADEPSTDEDKTDEVKTDEVKIEETIYEGQTGADLYENFLQKLKNTKDSREKPAVRHAVYNLEWDSGEGMRRKDIFIAWVPQDAPVRMRMLYASSKESLKKALEFTGPEIHADSTDELEWKTVLKEVSGGKLKA